MRIGYEDALKEAYELKAIFEQAQRERLIQDWKDWAWELYKANCDSAEYVGWGGELCRW